MTDQSQSLRLVVDDQIAITEIRPDDAAAFVEYLNDSEIYKTTLRIPSPYQSTDAERFLKIAAEAAQKHGHPVHFAIRDATERAIGGIGFDPLSYGHRAEIGYWLGRPFWGRGIMTSVVRTICDFAIEKWSLVRITGHVFVGNEASARVLTKNGFQFEGQLRKFHKKDGAYIDSMLFGLVVNDE